MKFVAALFILLLASSSFASEKAIDYVLVKKVERTMQLLSGGKVIKEYDIALGANPVGHKQQEGDERTPEGKYTLDYKKENSSFFRAIHISYPNEKDKERAKAANVDPGGLIMIHGQKNGFGWLAWVSQWFNWTNGCIAVTNSEMAEIWALVKVGTPIEIQP
ncbi:L,D-transpeptidase family protein [uncultured Desulfuromonas sp.]|uniref:L,D-transpeptidase family protein n=1 Tax=uncultured Desulfuromonas sp. TaxID=181013 RepID=UPI002AAAA107|nr:L,D-transpeptidase family protein [uncultured Desulfuromonas sp.]